MKIVLVCLILAVLSALQYRVILRGRWYVEKPIKIPNHWAGHAVIGIVVVVSLNRMFLDMPLEIYRSLFVTFLSPFMFIYMASLKSWRIYTDIAPAILGVLTKLNELKPGNPGV